MSKQEHPSYFAYCRDCNLLTAAIHDVPSHATQVAEDVAAAIKEGDYIERVPTNMILPKFCHCDETEAQEAERRGQARLFSA